MVHRYRYEFDNTPEKVEKFYTQLKKIAFEFPTFSTSHNSNSFFKLETLCDYETYVGIICGSPMGEGKRTVEVQTTRSQELYGNQYIDGVLEKALKSVDAKPKNE